MFNQKYKENSVKSTVIAIDMINKPIIFFDPESSQ
jgi:hypothetical protein